MEKTIIKRNLPMRAGTVDQKNKEVLGPELITPDLLPRQRGGMKLLLTFNHKDFP